MFTITCTGETTPSDQKKLVHVRRFLPVFFGAGCLLICVLTLAVCNFLGPVKLLPIELVSGHLEDRASQAVLVVKNPLAYVGDIRDTSLISGLERPPGGGMATHSNKLSGESHGQRSLAGHSV